MRAPDPLLLQPALACNADIVPVAIRYTRSDGSLCTEADYEGEKNLAQSLLQLATQRRVNLELYFLAPIHSEGRHRRELADAAAQCIAAKLGLAAPSRRAETAPGPTA